jgi:hypothetical protein
MTSDQAALANFSCAKTAPAEAWAVVMYFYAAVHAVNHHAYGRKRVPNDFKHWDRNQHVMLKLKSVDSKYRALTSLAHEARYRAELLPLTDADVAKARALALAVFSGAGVTVPDPASD